CSSDLDQYIRVDEIRHTQHLPDELPLGKLRDRLAPTIEPDDTGHNHIETCVRLFVKHERLMFLDPDLLTQIGDVRQDKPRNVFEHGDLLEEQRLLKTGHFPGMKNKIVQLPALIVPQAPHVAVVLLRVDLIKGPCRHLLNEGVRVEKLCNQVQLEVFDPL